MPILHRIPLRALLTSSIVALALGGCSFHYSSGSSSPSRNSGGSSVKPVHSKKSPTKVDNRVKPVSSSDTKGTKKVDSTPDATPDAPAKVNPPKRDLPESGEATRTTGAPKRTPAPAKRTPVADDTQEVEDGGSPASSTTFKAKTKPKTPPADNDTLVAPK